MTSHDATFYIQLEPEWSHWADSNGDRSVRAIKAVAITQKRPSRQRAGTVLTKLTLRVPDGAFLPLRPEAIVIIPESMTEVGPIQVEAVDPNE